MPLPGSDAHFCPGADDIADGRQDGISSARRQQVTAWALAATMLVLFAATVRSKPLFGALLMTGARRFALTGLYQAGIAPGQRAWIAGG